MIAISSGVGSSWRSAEVPFRADPLRMVRDVLIEETTRLQTSLRTAEPLCRARDPYPTVTQPSDAKRPHDCARSRASMAPLHASTGARDRGGNRQQTPETSVSTPDSQSMEKDFSRSTKTAG